MSGHASISIWLNSPASINIYFDFSVAIASAEQKQEMQHGMACHRAARNSY